MDHWDTHSSIDHHNRNHRDHRYPSFSSTLLDQIYRSIDDSSTHSSNVSMKTLKQQQHHPVGDFARSKNPKKITEHVFFKHSSSSSSDSSGFSSSESDSFYKRSKSENSHHPIKPIRTTIVEKPPQIHQHGNFLRTKSKALKMYSDLKKVKQPISPGGRLASFLNSIFTGNTKKLNKINTTTTVADSSTNTCSSASSFSRSCLSNKTPSSSEKSKRSVRFLDESHKSNSTNRFMDEKCHNNNNKLYGNNHREWNHSNRVMEENRRVLEAAKELLRNYRKNKDVEISSNEEEDDAASCASSDLFELDNLSAIGIEKYREELPVYETTRLNTNGIISRS
ncbi:hypothetical protein AALP_AA4G019600 [Arabis alpina]|uniref:Protein BIG GRAIN 1-like B n=1 Tax=Arabis alpina TaxID=50452 RepID=A0A087H0K2_ARAAL|nr:hypothetical protein AALP_AA4G019600 [Arabis alpina]